MSLVLICLSSLSVSLDLCICLFRVHPSLSFPTIGLWEPLSETRTPKKYGSRLSSGNSVLVPQEI